MTRWEKLVASGPQELTSGLATIEPPPELACGPEEAAGGGGGVGGDTGGRGSGDWCRLPSWKACVGPAVGVACCAAILAVGASRSGVGLQWSEAGEVAKTAMDAATADELDATARLKSQFGKHVGCDNWKDIEMARISDATFGACSAACESTPGCQGFNHQAASECRGASWEGVNTCLLLQGPCREAESECWTHSNATSAAAGVPPPPVGTVKKEGYECENWRDILLGILRPSTTHYCAEACATVAGCTGFGFVEDGCPSTGPGYARPRSCFLWGGNCAESSAADSACWTQYAMGRPTKAKWSGVKYVTCNTRGPRGDHVMRGLGGQVSRNLCSGLPWEGYRTKVQMYLEHARWLAEGGSTELLILGDGLDIASGGCSVDEILNRYTRISFAAGAAVVAQAVSRQWPLAIFPYDRLDQRRENVMAAFDMPVDSLHDYRYANSGWLIGPPSDLAKLLECMLEKGKAEGLPTRGGAGSEQGYDDQHGLHACMFAHRDWVTLDYTGTLILGLEWFSLDDPPVSRDRDVLRNHAFHYQRQCFVHGNGGSFTRWFPLLSV